MVGMEPRQFSLYGISHKKNVDWTLALQEFFPYTGDDIRSFATQKAAQLRQERK